MSVRYSDRWSVRYSRSLSEGKAREAETESETEEEEFVAGSVLGFVVKSGSDRPLADARVTDGLVLA